MKFDGSLDCCNNSGGSSNFNKWGCCFYRDSECLFATVRCFLWLAWWWNIYEVRDLNGSHDYCGSECCFLLCHSDVTLWFYLQSDLMVLVIENTAPTPWSRGLIHGVLYSCFRMWCWFVFLWKRIFWPLNRIFSKPALWGIWIAVMCALILVWKGTIGWWTCLVDQTWPLRLRIMDH